VDEALAAQMRQAWNVTKALVTLDGTEAEYNRIKAYPGAQGSPFQRVLRNIGLLMEAGIRVHIRLHLTPENYEDLCALVAQLAQRFPAREQFSVHVSIVDSPCKPAAETYPAQTLAALHAQRNALIGLIKELGMRSSSALVGLRLGGCVADAPRSAIITPEGGLARCYRSTAETAGSIFDNPPSFPKPLRAMLQVPECESCVLYPDCQRNAHCRKSCNPASIEGRLAQMHADAWRAR